MTAESLKLRKWVLITGASEGIGAAFAKRFAREGWNLVLLARTQDKLAALAGELERSHGVEARVVPADLSEASSPGKIYEETTRQGIEISALVNNAGFGNRGVFAEASLAKYSEMIEVMVSSVVKLTHLYMQGMLKRKEGWIVNVSSTASFQPLPYASVYSASKAFVTTFSEALWMETRGTGVRVLNLCPGLTKTDFGLKAGHSDFHQSPIAEFPDAVVETAFRALQKNSPTAISGWYNQVFLFMVRLLPHRALLGLLPLVQKIRRRGPK